MKGKKPSDRITISTLNRLAMPLRTIINYYQINYSVLGEVGIRYKPDIAVAHNLPLALAYKSLHYIRLELYTRELTSIGGYKTADHGEQLEHLKVLLTGHERLDVSPYPYIAEATLIRRPLTAEQQVE